MLNTDIAKRFLGRNFITPYIVRYGETKNYIYELSSGTSPVRIGTMLYGVTVQAKKADKFSIISNKSDCFDSLVEAEEHIETLR